METIVTFLESLKIARKQAHANMTLTPLMAPDGDEPDYLTLDEALDEGVVTIDEVSADGRVPELMVINRGKKNILIIEGEELVGAKQNRCVNLSLLVPGLTNLNIHVSCVEQGRWRRESNAFKSGMKVMHAELRREFQGDVCRHMRCGDGPRSDQRKVWGDIRDKSRRMRAKSPTEAAGALFDMSKDALEEYEKAFRPVECQVGAVFTLNGRIAGLEAFGYHDTWKRFHGKLIQSYALDAIDRRGEVDGREAIPEMDVRRFITDLAEAEASEYGALGLGRNLRLDSGKASGAALVADDRLLHLSAFKKGLSNGGSRARYQRFSARRRNREPETDE